MMDAAAAIFVAALKQPLAKRVILSNVQQLPAPADTIGDERRLSNTTGSPGGVDKATRSLVAQVTGPSVKSLYRFVHTIVGPHFIAHH